MMRSDKLKDYNTEHNFSRASSQALTQRNSNVSHVTNEQPKRVDVSQMSLRTDESMSRFTASNDDLEGGMVSTMKSN